MIGGVRAGLALAALVLLAIPAWVTDPFTLRLLIVIAMYATLGVAWNILGGYAGYVNFGSAAF